MMPNKNMSVHVNVDVQSPTTLQMLMCLIQSPTTRNKGYLTFDINNLNNNNNSFE